jgi:phosphatidylinositol kinase/protein kinase (PI-3  family)
VAATIPFTLTTQMLDVFGGRESERFRVFEKLLIDSFMAVREHHVLLCGIAIMSVTSDMEHLNSLNDVHHLHKALMTEMSAAEARKCFKQLINAVLTSFASNLNDAMHSWYMANLAKKAYG